MPEDETDGLEAFEPPGPRFHPIADAFAEVSARKWAASVLEGDARAKRSRATATRGKCQKCKRATLARDKGGRPLCGPCARKAAA